jgi:sulfide:quinone oxidoreductase
VDGDDEHLYQPGLLFIPFGLGRPADLIRPRGDQLRPGILFRRAAVDRVDLEQGQVRLSDGTSLAYDVLVVATRAALSRFTGGRLVVGVVDMPIKCPVAPLEFCFLAAWYFRRRKIRDRVELTSVTPLDGAFTKAVCNRERCVTPVLSHPPGGGRAAGRRASGAGPRRRQGPRAERTGPRTPPRRPVR